MKQSLVPKFLERYRTECYLQSLSSNRATNDTYLKIPTSNILHQVEL